MLTTSVGGLALVIAIAAVTSGATIRGWQVILIGVLAYFSGAIAAIIIANRGVRALMLETSHLVTYSLNEWGVYAVANKTTTSTPWIAIRRVMVFDDFVFLFKDGSIIYVPKEAFADKSAVLAFANYASSKINPSARH
jgi:YcxB-like protein